MTARAEKVREAHRLRSEGLPIRVIAQLLGVSRQSASTYLSDPDLAKQRARRKRYQGRCVDCGGPTDGSNGAAKAAERCLPCRRAYQSTEEYRESVQLWTRETIIDAIRWWAAEYGNGEPPAIPDFFPGKARELGDFARAERAERLIAEHKIPWFNLLYHRFGSWSAGLEAAGYAARPAHGGGGNELRRRYMRTKVAA